MSEITLFFAIAYIIGTYTQVSQVNRLHPVRMSFKKCNILWFSISNIVIPCVI